MQILAISTLPVYKSYGMRAYIYACACSVQILLRSYRIRGPVS